MSVRNAGLQSALKKAAALKSVLENIDMKDEAGKLASMISHASGMRYSIGVTGQVNKGKSTIVNCILGAENDEFAPVGRFPNTSTITCFANSGAEDIKVVFEDGREKKISPANIKNYAAEDCVSGSRTGVKIVKVISRFPNLGQNIILVDTPGTDSALALKENVLYGYLERLDAVVFVSTADEPLVESERMLLQNLRNAGIKKLFFVVNKIDRLEEELLEQGLMHNRSVLRGLGLGDVEMFCISAHRHFLEGNDEGTAKLLGAIQHSAHYEYSLETTRELNDFIFSTTLSVRTSLQQSLELSKKKENEICSDIEKLIRLRHKFMGEHPAAAERFLKKWTDVSERLEAAISGIRDELQSEFIERIERASGVKLELLEKTLVRDSLSRFEDELEHNLDSLKNVLSDALRCYQADYCGIIGISQADAEGFSSGARGSNHIQLAGFPCGIEFFCGLCFSELPGLVCASLSSLSAVSSAGHEVKALRSGAPGRRFRWSRNSDASVSPVDLMRSHMLLGNAAYSVFSSLKSRGAQTKSEFVQTVCENIDAAAVIAAANVKKLRQLPAEIFRRFEQMADAELAGCIGRLEKAKTDRPSKDRISELKRRLREIESFESGFRNDMIEDAPAVKMPDDRFRNNKWERESC